MYCPNCGTQNEEGYKFCMKCGQPLSPTKSEPIVWAPETHTQKIQHTVRQAGANLSSSMELGSSGKGVFNIWGPFAGYGTQRHHVGWLMDNKGQNAIELQEKVGAKFRERKIPGTQLRKQTMTAQGLLVEQRPYFLLQRGLASVALYITEFGQDLFVSLASYLKPPISKFRVLMLVLIVIFQAFMMFVYPYLLSIAVLGTVSSFAPFSSEDPSMGGLLSLLCIIGPIGTINSFALLFFVIYSFYKWLTEKDFWAGLRVPPNEFNEDDLMAMKKAVEQTVRVSLDEIGLNPDDLKPASVSDRRRII